jgi:hypothetical protein
MLENQILTMNKDFPLTPPSPSRGEGDEHVPLPWRERIKVRGSGLSVFPLP